PRNQIRKTYTVTINKPLHPSDFNQINAGISLEDGLITVDSISFLDNAHSIKIRLHSGRNRIVRRLFEYLGYEVIKLDRTEYAGLTKHRLPVGLWRHLEMAEIIALQRQF